MKSIASDFQSIMRHVSLLDFKTSVFKHVTPYLLVRVDTGLKSSRFTPLESEGNAVLSAKHG
jgi:hypothetical protein